MVDWIESMDDKDLEELVYVHIWEGHYKVWFYERDYNKINFMWGKINTTLQNKEKEYEGTFSAKYASMTKIREKLNKGYIPIPKVYYKKLADGGIDIDRFEEEIYNKVRDVFNKSSDTDKAKLFGKLGMMDKMLYSL